MTGKNKCRALRELRKKIANENGIPFSTEECRYKGDCKGTCPRCDSELEYLEQQLARRRSLGKRVTVSAVAAGVLLGAGGCGFSGTTDLEGDVPMPYTEECTEPGTEDSSGGGDEEFVLAGEVAYEPDGTQ